MAEICCGVVSEKEASPACQSRSASSRAARRRRMEIRRVKYVAGVPMTVENENGFKQPRLSISPASFPRESDDDCSRELEVAASGGDGGQSSSADVVTTILRSCASAVSVDPESLPKFGVASVCGRRRDMEDAVAVHPSFLSGEESETSHLHYFGVYDGHGCSHVATRCKDRLHLLVKEELNKKAEPMEWKKMMEESFSRMDKEVIAWNKYALTSDCRCELQGPESDAVGSTAVVAIVSSDKIVVANCGDSRAVLCRNGKPIPLSNDHKPDRPDELNRIQAAGGRVIYWEGARVLGVLAMSRAIGDNYLKPYVSCEPEVTVTDRTAEDDCLIIASDGLWDVVSNETACGVARMCLKGKGPAAAAKAKMTTSVGESDEAVAAVENSDKACSDASLLLTKLALARRSSDNVSVVVIDLRKKEEKKNADGV